MSDIGAALNIGRSFGICAIWAIISCGFFLSSRRRHTIFDCDWSSDVCSSDLGAPDRGPSRHRRPRRGRASRPPRSGQIGRASCKGKSVDLGGRRLIKKKTKKKKIKKNKRKNKKKKKKKNKKQQKRI